MQIINCEQGSLEWFQARLGIPTASRFKDVMAKGQGKTRRTYMLQLAGEIITGELSEQFSNQHTERGNELEPEAKDLYQLQAKSKVDDCGFIKANIGNGYVGYSPDGLIGDDGLIEIKTKLAHLQLDYLLADKTPSEHMKQIQGGLLISERKWCDFISYCPGLPLFIKRIHRNEPMISAIKEALIEFNYDIALTINKVSKM